MTVFSRGKHLTETSGFEYRCGRDRGRLSYAPFYLPTWNFHHAHVVTFSFFPLSLGRPVEVALSTLFYLRNLYQPSLFTRVKAYDVPVYQCRHPQVRAFIAGFVGTALAEIKRVRAQRKRYISKRGGGVIQADHVQLCLSFQQGAIESITLVISSISTGEPLERFLFELDYMDLTRFRNEADKSVE